MKKLINRMLMFILAIFAYGNIFQAYADSIQLDSSKKATISKSKKKPARALVSKKRNANGNRGRNAIRKKLKRASFDYDYYNSSDSDDDTGNRRRPVRCQEEYGLTNSNAIGTVSFPDDQNGDAGAAAASACGNGGYLGAGGCSEGCTAVITGFNAEASFAGFSYNPFIGVVADYSMTCVTNYNCLALF